MEAEDLFGGFDPAEHEEEAGDRWGGTDAYQQSAGRTARYTREDWEQLGREGVARCNRSLIRLAMLMGVLFTSSVLSNTSPSNGDYEYGPAPR